MSRSILLIMGNVSEISCTENNNTYFMFRNFFYRAFKRQGGKILLAGQPKVDNIAYAHCMLDTEGYKNTIIICNTY
jgi:hypothetical protein